MHIYKINIYIYNQNMDWLKDVHDTRKLSSLKNIPHSKHSASMRPYLCLMYLFWNKFQYQNTTIIQQLNNGIRSFEVLLTIYDNRIHIKSDAIYNTICWYSFEKILEEIYSFLNEHNKEFIFLDISCDETFTKKHFKSLWKYFDEKYYPPKLYIFDEQICNLRGSLIPVISNDTIMYKPIHMGYINKNNNIHMNNVEYDNLNLLNNKLNFVKIPFVNNKIVEKLYKVNIYDD